MPNRKNYGISIVHYLKRAVIFLGKQQLHGIVDSVRTKVLDWSLILEQKGILGEDMTFNEIERTNAQSITITNVVGSTTNVPVQQGIENTMTIESCNADKKISAVNPGVFDKMSIIHEYS